MAALYKITFSDQSDSSVNPVTKYYTSEARNGAETIQLAYQLRIGAVIECELVTNNVQFNPDETEANVGAQVEYVLSTGAIVTGVFFGRDYGRILQIMTQFIGATPRSCVYVPFVYGGVLTAG